MISILKLHWTIVLFTSKRIALDIPIDSRVLCESNKKFATSAYRCAAFHSRSVSTTSQVAKLTVVETNEDNEPG